MWVINLSAWIIHAIEAIYSLYLCDEVKLTHASALKWFLQTFVCGFSSLRLLLAYKAKKRA